MKSFSGVKSFFQRHRKLRLLVKLILAIFVIIIVSGILTFGGLEAGCRPAASNTILGQGESQIPQQELRPEVSTYLTYPEWFIVYSSDEYARFLSQNPPSQFPYFGSIHQYWSNYCRVYAITKSRHEFNAGDHLMLFVIGWSYSGEFAIKGVYENTVGRITQIFGHYPATSEDIYADKVATDYVNFIRLRPWYEYNFAGAFKNLWLDNNFFGPHFVRKFERRMFLSLEYGIKTVYGWFIGVGSHSVYGLESVSTYVVADNVNESLFTIYPEIKKVDQVGPHKYIMAVPRYQPFTDLAPKLASQGVTFIDIAGNSEIFITALVPRGLNYQPPAGQVVFETNILTDQSKKRLGLSIPVTSLSQVLLELQKQQAFIEHIYDY
jgi:hypothetical protein